MTTINLIPPKIKNAQRVKRISRLASSSLFSILLMILIVYGAIYLADTFIVTDVNAVNQSIAEAEYKLKNLKEVEDRITAVNAKISRLSTLQSKNILWSDAITKLNSAVPEKITITSITMDNATKKFTESGTAPTRREIVRLQAKLEESDYFANVVYGSSTLDEKTGVITFSLTGDFIK